MCRNWWQSDADIMTIAEKLYKKGMERGIEKGRLEGREFGIREGKRL